VGECGAERMRKRAMSFGILRMRKNPNEVLVV